MNVVLPIFTCGAAEHATVRRVAIVREERNLIVRVQNLHIFAEPSYIVIIKEGTSGFAVRPLSVIIRCDATGTQDAERESLF